MNDLYTYQLETENKQLREALHTTRKVLEEEIASKKKAIEWIKEDYDGGYFECGESDIKELLEILGDKE